MLTDDDEEDGDEEETEESSDEEEEDGPGLAGKFNFLLQNFHRQNLPLWIGYIDVKKNPDTVVPGFSALCPSP